MGVIEFDYIIIIFYNAAIMVEKANREINLLVEIELGKEYFPFQGENWMDLNVVQGELSNWRFKFGEVDGELSANLSEPFFHDVYYDDPPAFPLGSTNYDGANLPEQDGVMFTLDTVFDSVEKYDWAEKYTAVFRFSDQEYLLGLNGDGLLDDGEDFNDTEELYDDLEQGIVRDLSNYRMRQSSRGFFQVAVPRNADLSKISVKFLDRIVAGLGSELDTMSEKDRKKLFDELSSDI